MPKALIYAFLVIAILALIPPALIAQMRAVPSHNRRIHLIQDMDNQHKVRAQHESPWVLDEHDERVYFFADMRGMRPPVQGSVARGELMDDDHYWRGVEGGQWAASFPGQMTVDQQLLLRGQERFNIYCQPCHGAAGYGDGVIHQRANTLMLTAVNGTTWVQPKSLHEELIRQQPPGQIFNTITNGIRTMSGYEAQIPVADRWAIVAYVKALQRSQHAVRGVDVPEQMESVLTPVEIDLRTDKGEGAAQP
jgi:mono/diheme cytochrome c family protein